MSCSFVRRSLLLSVSGLGFLVNQNAIAADLPNGKPQVLSAHRAKHVAPVSTAPADIAQPNGAPIVPLAYSGPHTDVLTYHYDNNRTGWNSTETDLTPATVASGKFTRLATLQVNGNVLAQPLLVSNYKMPDGSVHDVLLIATGRDTIYAFDAQTYTELWVRSLGQPQSSNDVGCSDVVPEYGITGTPVILRNSNGSATMYVVAAVEPSPYSFHSYLHAIDVGTGKDALPEREIAPSAKLFDGSTISFDPQNQWNRPGLAANNGSIYVSIGSHCDNNSGSITGWELRFNASNNLQTGAFHTIETPGGLELASIWMTGFAPAIDSSGNVFLSTGNGNFTKGAKDWGQSVLRLLPNLSGVLNKFEPADYAYLNAPSNDLDLGAGGVMLLPQVPGQTVPPLAVAMGKAGVLYLLNQTALGNEQPNDAGALQEQTVPGNGLWGGPAFFNGANGPTVFVQTDSDVLRAYAVSTTGKAALTPVLAGTSQAGYGGSIPVVSSKGNSNGVVWLVRRSVPMSLEAYDASKLGVPIYQSNAGTWSNTDDENSFVAPVEANGRVYAPAYRTVEVFGLKQ